ncbi:MAG: aminopeptidase N [Cognaticolwellia sp.]|jgi:aminopeptidase N
MIKYILLFFTILSFSNTYGQINDWNVCDISESEAKSSQMNYFSEPLNKNILTKNYDLKYHRLELEIDPDIYYIKGIVTTYFEMKESNINAIYFDITDSLTVDSVIYHGTNLIFEKSEKDLLKINFLTPLLQDDLDSLTVYYQGEPPAGDGFGSFVQDYHNNKPIIWTLSEPYGAKDWWVCKQSLSDKIDSIDIFVTVPNGNRVASNGLLVNEITQNNKTTFHWKHRYLIETYLVAIAVTNYVEYSDYYDLQNGDSLLLLHYVYPEDSVKLIKKAARLLDFMEIFSDIFGEYPFANEKYGHAQFSRGGGMEHQTMSFMTNYNFELVAHELVHQWFGNKVTCGSWEDIWLNESFATYFTGIAYERIYPDLYWKPWREIQMENSRGLPNQSIFVEDTTSVGRIFSYPTTYAKGAMMLHTLRWKTGDDAFFQAVYNYMNDPKLAFGYARSSDFIRHIETTSGMDLGNFFEDWLYGSGHPNYTISWENISESEIKVTVNQTQTDASVLFFDLPLPIRIQSGTEIQDFVLDNTFNGETFILNTDFQPDTLLFDADLWILKGEEIVYQIQPLETMLLISPNPTTDFINIELENTIETIDYIEVYNSVGQKVKGWEIDKLKRVEVNVSSLSSGVYIVHISTSLGTVNRRIMISD